MGANVGAFDYPVLFSYGLPMLLGENIATAEIALLDLTACE
jgi:hypothetical protein